MTQRTNKPMTVTLTPEAVEGVEILKQELSDKAASRVVDYAIRKAVIDLGYEKVGDKEGTMNINIISEDAILLQHSHEGETYLEAPKDSKYIIQLFNNSYERRLFVISVDGVNIVNGKDASVAGPGYVLEAGAMTSINGWHRTNEETAAFTFEGLGQTYSVQTGRGESNVGVIGVASFRPKEVSFWRRQDGFKTNKKMDEGILGRGISNNVDSLSTGDTYTYLSRNKAIRAGRTREELGIKFCSESTEIEKIGTGYGEKLEMKTRETTFTRASDSPFETFTLRYETRASLIKLGVIKDVASKPNPFPADVGVKAPPGWKG